MLKGYVAGWQSHAEPENTNNVEVGFDSDSQKAHQWDALEEADIACHVFERWQIEIPSSKGGTHVCRDFRIEERAPNEYVVFCEAPFIPRTVPNRNLCYG